MNILKAYKRTRLFLGVNITGLSIGLAVSIMLVLFVVNELSYDKHFENKERIIKLNSVFDENGFGFTPLNLRKAYTELPEKVAGIEAAVQIYNGYSIEAVYQNERYGDLKMLYADADFFKVFRMKFIEGTPQSAFTNTNAVVITERTANKIFGSMSDALGKVIKISETDYTVSGVVKELPVNTHFTFDILVNMQSITDLSRMNLEFHTYYLVKDNVLLDEVRASVEREYTAMIEPFGAQFNSKAHGETEKLTDLYLRSKADFGLGKRSNMNFIWLLSGLALLILLLAISNFVNLFMAQGETRMNEIGIRKASGAEKQDIVKQFFKEVAITVLIAFFIGFILVLVLTPLLSKLINRDVDYIQLIDPVFILCIIGLFIITVILSAFYPAFYLSRFKPLDILGKRLKFSKRRLNTIVVTFQSIITILLIFSILLIYRQTNYLKDLPIGYNPDNIFMVALTADAGKSYESVVQELKALPDVEMTAGSNHALGYGGSGQGIGLLENSEKNSTIWEYSVTPGFGELVKFQLKEGSFFREGVPDSVKQIILNEAAVKMLELEAPVTGKYVSYYGRAEIIGVINDFYYQDLANEVQPLLLSRTTQPNLIYLKFNSKAGKNELQEKITEVIRKFDPGYVLFGKWADDIYNEKFKEIETQSRIILTASLLSLFIAMIGLIAIHLYTTMRRTKEIGIRRVNGAQSRDLFIMLSSDIIKWIIIAGLLAMPLAYYISTEWLANYAKRISLDCSLFAIPVLIQCLVAIIITSGVSYRALMRNPIESLKSE